MALRTRSVTSGPGRSPGSDGRARHGRTRPRPRSPSRLRAHAAVRTGTPARVGTRPVPGPGLPSAPASPPFPVPRSPVPASAPSPAVARAPVAPLTEPRRRAAALFPAAAVDAPTAATSVDPAEPRVRRKGERRRAWAGALVAVRERLPLWVQLRCGLELRTLGALAVVLVVAAGLAAQHFWTGRPQPVRAPESVRADAAAPGDMPVGLPEPLPKAVAPEPPPPPETARIVVDIGGKVREPGVLRLPAGSRVADALRAAGGVEPGADLTGLNRARLLMDGEQVVVDGPAPPGAAPGGGLGGPGAGAAAGFGPGAGPGGPQAVPVSLNTATPDQLDTLPGVGPVLARHIIDYRTQHGGFRSVDELREVNGIGDRKFADLQPLVRP
ncbi:helix-hairpin-helix domain-containing protein [Streptomyces sp. NPDC096310]|uniref:helix-hairpin-helix domain-containing protein n=1 Tax=Streptomyces sp. NPDC096310 TaxID=3366082 RepID=UPI00381BE9A7